MSYRRIGFNRRNWSRFHGGRWGYNWNGGDWNINGSSRCVRNDRRNNFRNGIVGFILLRFKNVFH